MKKTRQNAENQQTFGLKGKIESNEKNSSKRRKQNKPLVWRLTMTAKIEINEKSRQNAENKQTFGLRRRI